jgi:hypothetical protein
LRTIFKGGNTMAINRFRGRSTTKALLLAVALVITGTLGLVVSALANPSFNDDYTADVDEYNVVDRAAPWAALEHSHRPSIPAGVVIFGLNGLAAGGNNETAATSKRRGAFVRTKGDYFVDYTGRRAKYQTSSCLVDPNCAFDEDIDIYNFYNNGTSYVVRDSTGECTMYALPAMGIPTFNWLANATKLSTPCLQFVDSGKTGEHWRLDHGDGEVQDFCGSTDEKTPYWVWWQWPAKAAWLVFRTYTASRPSPSVFALPNSCTE